MRFTLLFLLLFSSPLALPRSVDEVAKKYIGTRETHGANRSPIIDAWNRRVSAPLGSPYCASAISSWLDSTDTGIRTRSARSRAFLAEAISIKHVIRGAYRIRKGDILVWRRNGGGHIGVAAQDWHGLAGYTIEANTSPGVGSQWNGDGVYRRYRTIEVASSFRIDAVVPREVATRLQLAHKTR